MSKRRLVNHCLIGAVLAVPLALLGIYSLTFGQGPESAAFPSEASLQPVLRIAQADQNPTVGNRGMAAWDVPGGMALDPNAKKRQYLGLAQSCITCHSKATINAPVNQIAIPGFPRFTDDGWALLNEALIWGSQDKHYGSYAVLLNDRSKQMAKILKIVDDEGNSLIHRDLRCIACHSGMPIYEMTLDEGHPGRISEDMVKDLRLNFGVSCEGCHGSAGGPATSSWVSAHVNKAEWRFKDPEVKARDFGYYDVRSPVSRTRMCLSCHVGSFHEGRVVTHEMYAAGHPPLPGFDVETFSSQEPQHWRDFQHKSEKIRNEFVEQTKSWRKSEWQQDALHNSRDLLIGACINLSEMLKLTATLADSETAIPNSGEEWPSKPGEQWPEFAQFACYSCHHDLKDQGWRIKRTPIGVPGRPPLHEWPFTLVKIALEVDGEADPAILDLMERVKLAGVSGPYGNREELKTLGPELAKALDAYALELEARPLPRNDAPKLLGRLIALAQKETLDYDSARQVVWALRIIYDEWQGDPLNAEEYYTPKKIDELPGWYTNQEDLKPFQKVLASFEDVLLVDLRKGRSTVEKVGAAEEDERPVLEWEASKALPKIGNYEPEAFQKKLEELQAILAQ